MGDDRKGGTVRFAAKFYSVLEQWAELGHRGSVPQLVEWIVIQVLAGKTVEVPIEVNQPPLQQLQQLEPEQFDSLSDLCLHFWDKLQANPRIDKTELALIADGKKAGEVILLRIANTVGYPEEYLDQLNQGTTKKNGHAHNH